MTKSPEYLHARVQELTLTLRNLAPSKCTCSVFVKGACGACIAFRVLSATPTETLVWYTRYRAATRRKKRS